MSKANSAIGTIVTANYKNRSQGGWLVRKPGEPISATRHYRDLVCHDVNFAPAVEEIWQGCSIVAQVQITEFGGILKQRDDLTQLKFTDGQFRPVDIYNAYWRDGSISRREYDAAAVKSAKLLELRADGTMWYE